MAGAVGNVTFDDLSVTVAAATAVCAAQAIGGAGNATINGTQASGGVASLTGALSNNGALTVGRRVAVVSSGAGDITQTATLTGTDRNGNVQSEVVALNGITSVGSVLDYLTVTKVAVSAVMAGSLSVGTNNTASSPWRPANTQIAPVQVGFYLHKVAATAVTGSVEETMDDPMAINAMLFASGNASIEPDSFIPPTAFADQSTGTLTAKTADAWGTLNMPVAAYRMTVIAGQGRMTLQAIQAGLHQ